MNRPRTRSCSRVPTGTKCSIEGCGRPFLAKGYCRKHYARVYKYGDPATVKRGENGKGSIKRGYVSRTIGGKTQLEHRHVMEQSLGRDLLPGETVHHKNGIRSDNRLVKGHELHCPGTCCNLELWSKSQPYGQRVRDKLAWAREIIRLYEVYPEEHDAAAE